MFDFSYFKNLIAPQPVDLGLYQTKDGKATDALKALIRKFDATALKALYRQGLDPKLSFNDVSNDTFLHYIVALTVDQDAYLPKLKFIEEMLSSNQVKMMLNQPNKRTQVPLHLLTSYYDPIPLFQILTKQGADPFFTHGNDIAPALIYSFFTRNQCHYEARKTLKMKMRALLGEEGYATLKGMAKTQTLAGFFNLSGKCHLNGITFDLEGNTSYPFKEKLAKEIQQLGTQDLVSSHVVTQLIDAFKVPAEKRVLSKAKAEEMINRQKAGKIVPLYIGDPEHAIVIFIYKDYLIFCDGNPNSRYDICHFNTDKLTPELLFELSKTILLPAAESKKAVADIINNQLEAKQDAVLTSALPTSRQKSGNCYYYALKLAAYGASMVLNAEGLEGDLQTTAMQQARKWTKKLVTYSLKQKSLLSYVKEPQQSQPLKERCCAKLDKAIKKAKE